MARTTRLGALLVALYIAVAAATTSWAPGRLRPLFDGFGSHPGVYNWANPPREFAEGNMKPDSAESEIRFENGSSQAMSAGPGDGQVLVQLEPGVVDDHPPDTTATVRLTPLDATGLGPLPAGLRPEGNAYRIEIDYASGLEVVALEKPGLVGLTSAAPADTLLHSVDGRRWEAVAAKPLESGNGITGTLPAPGYYLAAAKGAAREAGGATGSGSGATIVIVVAALAVPAALVWLLLARRRPAAGRGAQPRGQGGKGIARSSGPGPAKRPRQAKRPGQAKESGQAKRSGSAKGANRGKGGGKGAPPR